MAKVRRLCRASIALIFPLAIAGWSAAIAQTPAKKSDLATGSVTGEVTCADTNAPARFAIVTLEPVPGQKNAEAMRAAGGTMTVGDKIVASYNATATTDINGRFVMEKVPAGRYYVIGGLAGYLNPLAQFDDEQLKAMTEETQKALTAKLQTVTVDANQPATVNLRLDHASQISGTVLYDDGSPAVAVRMHLLHRKKDGTLEDGRTGLMEGTSLFGRDTQTDDHGRYLVIGLSPGEYVMEVTLPMTKVQVGGLLSGDRSSVSIGSSREADLSIYTGGGFRAKSAKGIKVENGDPVSGVDITIPVNGLHTIRGFATALRDGHGLDGGQVDLLYADDREKKMTVRVEEDGSFVFANVPEDRYVLRLTGVKAYSDTELPLVVQGDMDGVLITAPETKTVKTAAQ